MHIRGGKLPGRVDEIPCDADVHAVCGSGYRSSIAMSVLQQAGYLIVTNVSGGMTAWTMRILRF